MKHETFETASLHIERLDTEALKRLDARQWDTLSAHALVENPFYARQFVLAGLNTIDSDTPLAALALRTAGGALVGLFLYRLRRFPFAHAAAACNVYQPSCTPLIHRDHAPAVVCTWLDAIRRGQGAPRYWTLRHINLGSKFVRLVDEKRAGQGLCRLAVNTYKRPHLTRIEGGLDAHLESVLPKRRLKDIRRNLRRLQERGFLRFERTADPDLVAKRLEQFLALENSGWKGERGTAFLARRNHAAFARAAFAPTTESQSLVVTDTLLLDEEPIAVSINLRVRDTVFTPKCAYDEAYRSYAPGLVLEYLILEDFYESGGFAEMDAATTEDGHVLLGFWNSWKEMGTLVVGPAFWKTRALAGYVEGVRNLRQLAKRVLQWGPLRPLAKRLRTRGWLAGGESMPSELGLAAACAMAALYAE